MKKLTALILSAVMMFTLAGCNSSTTSDGSEGNSSSSGSTTSSDSLQSDSISSTLTTSSDNSQSNSSSSASTTSSDSSQSGATSSNNSESKSSSTASSPTETSTDSTPSETPTEGVKTLVAVYSASGNTKAIAEYIATATDADLFEITPTEPYTNDDLDWTNRNSRVSREHDDESLRDVELVTTTVDNWADYDTVFIGYPIWWGIAAWVVDGFVEANDFTGKTVIPFCTSTSSGLGQSGKLLAEMAGTGNWFEGQRFQSRASEDTVKDWVDSLDL